MKIIAVIPARYGSTRFPGKPLIKLKGKPLIQWVIEGTKTSKLVSEVFVATDDQRIFDVVTSCGVKAIMTPTDCATGTDRIFQATKNLDFDVVLNIQGDEPQITAEYIDLLAKAFIDQPNLDMATLAHPLSSEDLNNRNAVKVIKNVMSEAIYFSRLPLPGSEKHIGLYGYSKIFLKKFCEAPQAEIEKAESLEQLRALHLGAKIKVLSVPRAIQGVDTPEDLEKLEKAMS